MFQTVTISRGARILALCAALAPGAALAGPVAPEKVSAALTALDAMASRLTADGAVPGLAITVVHDDQVVFAKGFGLREVGRPETVDADTVFQLASFSKPISATVVAALVGKGYLDWDSKVSSLAPDFQLFDPYPSQQVTVRDLLDHRSGLPGAAGNDLESIGFSRDVILHRLALVPPSSSFRAGYSYSNAGFTMGALAAARPTGKDWETVAEDLLYRPLGMTETSSRYADFAARPNAAQLHVDLGKGWVAAIKRDADPQAPAGGVSSSARDIAAWMRLELANGKVGGEQLIPADALAATHAPLFPRGANPVTGAPSFYGLGWNVEYTRHGLQWGHAGAFSVGARTLVSLVPESGLGIVVLANAFPTGVPEALADSFFDTVFDGKPARDYFGPWNEAYSGMFAPAIAAAKATFAAPPSPATAARPDAAYVGRYANLYVGEALVSDEGGTLVLAVGPEGATRYALRHFDRDTFLYYADPELPDMPSIAVFALGPDGRSVTVTLSSLDDTGLGTLPRAD